MAPSNACVNVEKHTLGDIPMYVNRLGSISPITTLSWEVALADFPMMKNNTIYSTYVFDIDCKLSVIKKRKFTTLEIGTCIPYSYRIESSVVYDDNTRSSPVIANKLSNYSYTIQISSDKIHNPKNVFLRQTSFLVCRMDFAPEASVVTLRPLLGGETFKKGRVVSFYANREENNETEEEILSRNISDLPRILPIGDFKIYAKTLYLLAQRAVLAVRSKFFRDYFDKHTDKKEITLDTTLEDLKLVLIFMYNGSLPVQPLKTMLSLLELAVKLEMKSLASLCVRSVISVINPFTVKKIREAGSRNGIQELVTEADNFLASAPKDWTTQ